MKGAAGGPVKRPMFHVVNGDSTLALLRKTAVPGESMVWPDMLMEGPLLRRGLKAHIDVRAGGLEKVLLQAMARTTDGKAMPSNWPPAPGRPSGFRAPSARPSGATRPDSMPGG